MTKTTPFYFARLLNHWIVQGNLLDFDLSKFKIFSNTLQAIAVGYVFTTIAYVYLKTTQGSIFFFAVCLF